MNQFLRISLFIFCVQAQSSAQKLTNSEPPLLRHIEVLSSDSLEGRKTGTVGGFKAASYISNYLSQLNLSYPELDSNFHNFNIYSSHWGNVYIKYGNTTLNNFKEMAYLGHSPTTSEIDKKVIFVGSEDQFNANKYNIEDKVVMLAINNLRAYSRIIKQLKSKGAFAAILFNPDNDLQYKAVSSTMKDYILATRITTTKIDNTDKFKAFIVGNNQAAHLLKISENKLKSIKPADVGPFSISMNCEFIQELVQARNVIGILKTPDATESILVSAHFDHLGIIDSKIHNGADDNASGVATVLFLAEYLQENLANLKLKRNIIFLLTDAEEGGLLGSQQFVIDNYLEKLHVSANVNIDMVSRVDRNHRRNENYIYVCGTDIYPEFLTSVNHAQQLSNINADFSQDPSISIDAIYNRSDQANFHKSGIPSIFLFSGLHKDYHESSDDISNINLELLKNRAEFAKALIVHLASE